MNQLNKKCNVVMLAIEKAENCIIEERNRISFQKGYFTRVYLQSVPAKPYHLYITSDDEIKESDWVIQPLDKSIIKMSNNDMLDYLNSGSNATKKIIASTDKLIKYTNKDTDGIPEYLPQISESFIEKYIEQYNKGNQINEINVEYDIITKKYGSCSKGEGVTMNIEQLKLRSDNTIILSKVKDSYSKEEVIEIVRNAMLFQDRKTEKHLLQYVTSETYTNCYVFANEWIKENL